MRAACEALRPGGAKRAGAYKVCTNAVRYCPWELGQAGLCSQRLTRTLMYAARTALMPSSMLLNMLVICCKMCLPCAVVMVLVLACDRRAGAVPAGAGGGSER
jgi:hypothetical protein